MPMRTSQKPFIVEIKRRRRRRPARLVDLPRSRADKADTDKPVNFASLRSDTPGLAS
ncbi:hypothetical protein FHT82_001167 [Rhizobium sp. BK275]|nr:hypothetical protein [Rhizobium sp. BK275]